MGGGVSQSRLPGGAERGDLRSGPSLAGTEQRATRETDSQVDAGGARVAFYSFLRGPRLPELPAIKAGGVRVCAISPTEDTGPPRKDAGGEVAGDATRPASIGFLDPRRSELSVGLRDGLDSDGVADLWVVVDFCFGIDVHDGSADHPDTG